MRYAKLIPATPVCAAVACVAALTVPSVAAGPHKRAEKTPRFPIDLMELRAAETERFHVADADGDGGVDASEFTKLRPSRLTAARQWAAAGRGLGKRGKHAKRHRRAATEAARGVRDERREGVFAAADTNADGRLDADEFQRLPEVVRAERRRRIFERLDKDANGTLTADEFPSALARLERLDANGDGLIARGEMPKRRRR